MEYYDVVNEYIVKADNIIKSLFYALSPLYKSEFGEGQNITVPLLTTLHSTSESILILLLNHAIFDADVLLRTVMEGTIKYCYLLAGDTTIKAQKRNEFQFDLNDIDRISDHEKAKNTISILKQFSSNSTLPFETYILDDETLASLKQKYPAKKRNELKQKWSYQNLLCSLAQTYGEYEAQLGTLSTYSLTSHLIHYDWAGVSMRQAQIMDAPNKDAEVYDIAHATRIISNVLSFYMFRVTEYMRGNRYHCKKVAEISMVVIDLISELTKRGDTLIEDNDIVV